MNGQLLFQKLDIGNSEVQYQLGLRYCFCGDLNKALYWLLKAKMQNNIEASQALVEIYFSLLRVKAF